MDNIAVSGNNIKKIVDGNERRHLKYISLLFPLYKGSFAAYCFLV